MNYEIEKATRQLLESITPEGREKLDKELSEEKHEQLFRAQLDKIEKIAEELHSANKLSEKAIASAEKSAKKSSSSSTWSAVAAVFSAIAAIVATVFSVLSFFFKYVNV